MSLQVDRRIDIGRQNCKGRLSLPNAVSKRNGTAVSAQGRVTQKVWLGAAVRPLSLNGPCNGQWTRLDRSDDRIKATMLWMERSKTGYQCFRKLGLVCYDTGFDNTLKSTF